MYLLVCLCIFVNVIRVMMLKVMMLKVMIIYYCCCCYASAIYYGCVSVSVNHHVCYAHDCVSVSDYDANDYPRLHVNAHVDDRVDKTSLSSALWLTNIKIS